MRSSKRPLPEAISINLAADILGVHPMTIRRWIRRGYLKAYRCGPLLIRIPRTEIARMRKHRLILQDEPRVYYPIV